MANIIEMSYLVNNFCPPFVTCLVTFLLFNRTTGLHIWRVRQCRYKLVKTPAFIAPAMWPPNSQPGKLLDSKEAAGTCVSQSDSKR